MDIDMIAWTWAAIAFVGVVWSLTYTGLAVLAFRASDRAIEAERKAYDQLQATLEEHFPVSQAGKK